MEDISGGALEILPVFTLKTAHCHPLNDAPTAAAPLKLSTCVRCEISQKEARRSWLDLTSMFRKSKTSPSSGRGIPLSDFSNKVTLSPVVRKFVGSIRENLAIYSACHLMRLSLGRPENRCLLTSILRLGYSAGGINYAHDAFRPPTMEVNQRDICMLSQRVSGGISSSLQFTHESGCAANS